jgi:hypothetical protein
MPPGRLGVGIMYGDTYGPDGCPCWAADGQPETWLISCCPPHGYALWPDGEVTISEEW